jgi:LPXTG-site transpeptidase (sortase) family protein
MVQTFFERVWGQKYTFFSVFFVIFFLSYLFLVAVDFIPQTPKAAETSPNIEQNKVTEQPAKQEEKLPVGVFKEPTSPTTLYIKKLDRTVTISNPTSNSVAVLDEALLHGVVHHPDSAQLGSDGNVFILGHSSYLPVVINKNFQALNGIQNLAWGDTIEVRSATQVVTYQVEKVYKAKAEDVTVPMQGTGPRLTLATCNSFGSKDDRFIVEAKAVGTQQL